MTRLTQPSPQARVPAGPVRHGWAWVARWTITIVLCLAAGITLASAIG